MPQSIPPGLTREHVLRALADLDAGTVHPFGAPTGYELVHGEKRYAPKAVVGLACRYSIGRVLKPDEFSGGEAPGQANFVLRKLGFTVGKKGEEVTVDESPGSDWSEREVALVVADYFAMLEEELLVGALNKTEHRRALAAKLAARSAGAIEFKHANISAVLTGLGLPYVEGYKPRGNYQGLLAQEVEAYLDRNPTLLERIAGAPAVSPTVTPASDALDLERIVEDPPDAIPNTAPAEPDKPWRSRKGRRIDFAERDARNRHLGRLGEEFVVRLERHRLATAGRDDLAARVRWAADELGDGLGFDVLSFDDADESEKLVEVKTTALGKFFPFYVTATEVRCSEDAAAQYHLFRVFDFGNGPRVYILHGPLRASCQLDPVLYRAVI